jgi:hypothetical protein
LLKGANSEGDGLRQFWIVAVASSEKRDDCAEKE